MDDSPSGLAILLKSRHSGAPAQAPDPNDGAKYGDEPDAPPGMEAAIRQMFSHANAGDWGAAAKCFMTMDTLADGTDDGSPGE